MRSIKDSEVEGIVAKSNKVVVVDCFAIWCAPCKQLAPTLESLNSEMLDKAEFLKLDVDENQETPAKYNVRGIPTLLVFKGGKLVDQIVGNQPKSVIQNVIESHANAK